MRLTKKDVVFLSEILANKTKESILVLLSDIKPEDMFDFRVFYANERTCPCGNSEEFAITCNGTIHCSSCGELLFIASHKSDDTEIPLYDPVLGIKPKNMPKLQIETYTEVMKKKLKETKKLSIERKLEDIKVDVLALLDSAEEIEAENLDTEEEELLVLINEEEEENENNNESTESNELYSEEL